MKLGQFLAIWCATLLLVAVGLGITMSRQDSTAVFVGSSLTDHVIPHDDAGLSQELGGPYAKNVHRGVRRHSFIRERDYARGAGVDVVFVEVTHFLFDQARVIPSKGWFAHGWEPLRDLGKRFLGDVRVIGREALTQAGLKRDYTKRKIDREYKLIPEVIKELFPATPKRTREVDFLVRAIRDMQEAGGEVILVVPPLSEVAYELAGEGALEEVSQLAAALSKETGAKLFAPAAPWPNSFYIDSSHVNRAGRERFRAELIDWLSANRSVSIDG